MQLNSYRKASWLWWVFVVPQPSDSLLLYFQQIHGTNSRLLQTGFPPTDFTLKLSWYWDESESNTPSKWVHRESNLIFTLSIDWDQEKKIRFAFALAHCKWTLNWQNVTWKQPCLRLHADILKWNSYVHKSMKSNAYPVQNFTVALFTLTTLKEVWSAPTVPAFSHIGLSASRFSIM